MKQLVALFLTLVVGATFAPPQSAVASEGSLIQIPSNSTPLPQESKPQKVMCSWLAYGRTDYMCGDPPLEEVKAKCDKKVTEERGEKSECACTEDPDFIKDMCGSN